MTMLSIPKINDDCSVSRGYENPVLTYIFCQKPNADRAIFFHWVHETGCLDQLGKLMTL